MRLSDEQIGAELRALREIPTEDFAAELDAWAAEGFPSAKDLERPKAARRGFRSFIGQRPLLAGLAGSAVIVMVVGASVAAYLRGGDDTSGPLSAPGDDLGVVHESGEISGQGAAAQSQLRSKQAAGTAAEPLIAPAPPTGSRPRIGRPQVQELSASLGLSTDADQLQQAADGVVEVTNRYDGFVDSSDVRVGGRQSHASFSLRIPATDLRDALDDLSGLGRVTLRDEASANVTGAYVDAGKAHREARAKVDSLLAQLRDASSPSEAAAIRQQLVPARQQLAAARAALRGMKQRVTYAPVSVQIKADGDGSWSIGDAADDAVGVLEAIAGGLLIALAVLVPIAALLALGWLGAREFGRRRREATLDR
jgi:Domain of unknown function (DUF4349)